MAKSYTYTVKLRCWKQHTCSCCGAQYSYILARKVVGRGRTAARAETNAQVRVKRTTEQDTDMHPCPTCGLYQADMIAQRRAKSRIQLFWLALVALVTVLIIRACDGLQANQLTWIAAACFGAAVLAHFLLELLNNNANPAANIQIAQQRVADGTLRHTPGDPNAPTNAQSDELSRPSRPLPHTITLALLLASFVLVLSPELLRTVSGWPLNAKCYPPVVGPTDHTRIYMQDTITSIKSYWKGDPVVTIRHSADPDDGTLIDASTNQNDWGTTIEAKPEEKTSTSHPWVEITLPEDAANGGKSVTCDVDLQLQYPQVQGDSSFEVEQSEMKDSFPLNLASTGAGAKYNSLWWSGTSIGGALIAACSLILYSQARAFGRKAKPTSVSPVTA